MSRRVSFSTGNPVHVVLDLDTKKVVSIEVDVNELWDKETTVYVEGEDGLWQAIPEGDDLEYEARAVLDGVEIADFPPPSY